MKMTITLLSLLVLGILTMPVQANHKLSFSDRYDRISKRLENQHHRIYQGIRNGELTRQEVWHLRKQQQFIKRLTYRFMHDGYMDRFEFKELKNELDRASEYIYRLKHNRRFQSARYYYY